MRWAVTRPHSDPRPEKGRANTAQHRARQRTHARARHTRAPTGALHVCVRSVAVFSALCALARLGRCFPVTSSRRSVRLPHVYVPYDLLSYLPHDTPLSRRWSLDRVRYVVVRALSAFASRCSPTLQFCSRLWHLGYRPVLPVLSNTGACIGDTDVHVHSGCSDSGESLFCRPVSC